MAHTILLADDSVTVRRVVEATFLDTDIRVDAVGSGREALERFEAVRPDLVLADIVMPEPGGYDLCRTVKASPRPVPVLLLRGTFEPFDESLARECGADGYLTKPFQADNLVERVTALLARRAGGASTAAKPLATEPPSASPSTEPPSEPVEAPPVEATPTTVSETSLELPAPPPAEKTLSGTSAPAAEDVTPPEAPAPAERATAPSVEPEAVPETLADDPVAEPRAVPVERIASPRAEIPVEVTPDECEATAETEAPRRGFRIEAVGIDPPAGAAAVSSGNRPEATVSSGASEVDGRLVEEITARVLERLSERVVREIAWEVVPDLAESLIRERLREIERAAALEGDGTESDPTTR